MAPNIDVAVTAEFPDAGVSHEGPFISRVPRNASLHDLEDMFRGDLGLAPATPVKVRPLDRHRIAQEGWESGDRFLVTVLSKSNNERKKKSLTVEEENRLLLEENARLRAELAVLKGTLSQAADTAAVPLKTQSVRPKPLTLSPSKNTRTNPIKECAPPLLSTVSCTGKVIPDVMLHDVFTDDIMKLSTVISGKLAVLDFWSTTCPNCPSAVNRVELMASLEQYRENVVFLVINTNDKELARSQIISSGWHTCQHYFINLYDKEKLKSFLSMVKLPFHAFVDKDMSVIMSGKGFNWEAFEDHVLRTLKRSPLQPQRIPLMDKNLFSNATLIQEKVPETSTTLFAGRRLDFGENENTVPNVRLLDIASSRTDTLHKVMGKRSTVLLIWSKTDQQAARQLITNLEQIASSSQYKENATFLVINVDDRYNAQSLKQQYGWRKCQYFFAPAEDRKRLEKYFSPSTLPFGALLDEKSEVVISGDDFSLESVDVYLSQALKPTLANKSISLATEQPVPNSSAEHIFSLDEDF